MKNTMRTFAAKEAKDNFGELLDTAIREPVTIAKNGRPVTVMLSVQEYQRIESIEDAYWATRAKLAENEGFIGEEESEAFLEKLLHAEA